MAFCYFLMLIYTKKSIYQLSHSDSSHVRRVISQISNLVCTTLFWNNLHHVCSKPKYMKAKQLKSFREQENQRAWTEQSKSSMGNYAWDRGFLIVCFNHKQICLYTWPMWGRKTLVLIIHKYVFACGLILKVTDCGHLCLCETAEA